MDFRIDAVLKDMGQTLLCELPDQTAWSVEQFLSRTEVGYFRNFTCSCPLIRITAVQVVSPVVAPEQYLVVTSISFTVKLLASVTNF